MTPEQYRRIRELFDAALAVHPSGRTAFLRDECGGDRELERHLANLLMADAAADSFLSAGPLPDLLRRTATGGTDSPVGIAEFPGTERFRVIRKIGAGGFGIVYEVTDLRFDSVVALKTLPSTMPEAINRLKREFRALAEVTHPNLVLLYELFQEREYCFFTMELIDGVDFLQHAIEVGPGPEFRDALVQLASGVNALHDAGKLHCDLKPHNVLADRSGRIVVLDFGLITEIGSSMGVIAGTPEYMAPEQALGLPLSPATDWYGFGAILYHALTRRPPVSGKLQSVLNKKQSPIEKTPSDIGDHVPEDLSRLCMDLLVVDPAARPSGREVLKRLGGSGNRALSSAVASRAAPRLFGRDRELNVLSGALESAAQGSVVTVLVHGISGAGKTALISHFADTVRRQNRGLVLEGRCYERESVPFKALDGVIEALNRYLRTLPEPELAGLLPEGLQHLTRLFPVLRWTRRLAPPAVDIPDLRELRIQAFRALLNLLSSVAARATLVLVIDDLQWGDADSAPVIRELQRAMPSSPILLVASYRSDQDTSPLLRAIGSARDEHGRVTDLPVRELTEAAALQLASHLLDVGGAANRDRAEQLAHESGGHPFFLTELVKYSERHASFRESLSLDDMLRVRIASLAVSARRLLSIVAVAGQPLDLRIATGAAEVQSGGQRELVSLSGARLIRFRSTGGEGEIETWHDRIRETTTESLDPADRAGCHYKLATTWEASSHADSRALAVHFLAASVSDKAKKYALEAAGQASEALAFESAARFYRLALQASPADATDVGWLQRRLGDSLSNAGRGREAGEAYTAAARHADGTEKLDLNRRAATQFMITGHVDLSMPLVHEVARAAGMGIASSPWLAILQFLFWRSLTRIRGSHFRERPASSVDERELLRVDICFSIVQGLGMVDLIRAHPFQAKGILLALRCGEPCRMSRALALWAAQLAIRGRPSQKKIEHLLAQAETLARRGQSELEIGIVSMVRALSAFLSGNWRGAAEKFAFSESIFREKCTAAHWDMALCHMMGSVSHMLMGSLNELRQSLPRIIREAEVRGDLFEITDLRIRLSHALTLAADEPERAMFDLRESIARWRTGAFDLQHWWALIASTEIELYSAQADSAWERWVREWPLLRRSLFLSVQYVRIESLQHRGRAALAFASSGKADPKQVPLPIRRARLDAARVEREDAPWAKALATLLRAGIAADLGNTTEAGRLLSIGETACRDADMELYAAAAQRMRGILEGGRSGSRLIAAADQWMSGQEIQNPRRMAAMLIPGIERQL